MSAIANSTAGITAVKEHHEVFLARILQIGAMPPPPETPVLAVAVPAPAAPTPAPPTPAAPAATAAAGRAPVDPVLGQQLLAAKTAVDEATKAALASKKAEQAALDREAAVIAELAAVKRQALTDHAEASLRMAALEGLWGEENAAKLAAQEELAALKAAVPSSRLLGIIPPEMVGKFEELESFMGSQEGKAFLAAFAAGDDAAVDMVTMMIRPMVEAMVKKIPAGKIDLTGRSVDHIGKILMHALLERAEEEEKAEQPEPAAVPDPAAAPAARQHPLKKGKARRVNRHGSLDELADLVGTGELRVRAA